MTVPDVHAALETPTIPRPRSAERLPVAPPERPVEPSAPPQPAGRYPWPEPWGSFRGPRPRTEYWDVETASWRSRGPRRPSAD